MKRHGPWRTLALDPTDDRSAIRRAYADKLRQLDVDKDIAGYARLRDARDHALVLAKSLAACADEPEAPLEQMALEPADGPAEFDEAAECDAIWDEADFDLLDFAPRDMQAADFAVEREFLEQPAIAQAASPDGPAEPAPPQVLLDILFPAGETSEQQLANEEWSHARQALAAILQEAEQSSVDQQAAIDNWLAHQLASAWPRSAWLVEPAAEAFGWMDESGQLTERPAVQFLNVRLRGLRFVAKVEAPDHPLHKAWTELSKPGPKGMFTFLRVGKDDVRQLLEGIRERFPEVESYLDAERVASWETGFGHTPWTPWRVVGRILFILFIVVQIARVVGTFSNPTEGEPTIQVGVAWSAEQVDEAVVDLFGERLDNDTLRIEAPDLWSNLDQASGFGGGSPSAVADVRRALLRQLRAQSQLAARNANFDELVAIKQVKLTLLRFAREQGGADDCVDFETQGSFPVSVAVPEAVRVEERQLAARLAAANLLVPSDSRFPESANIPGPVIGQVIDSTGLSEDIVRAAIRGQGSNEVRCAYRIALLEAVLERPSDVTADLLRII